MNTLFKNLFIFLICATLSSCRDNRQIVAPKPSPYTKKKQVKKPSHEGLNPEEQRKQKRMAVQERHAKLNHHGKQLKDLSFDELQNAKNIFLEEDDKENALKYLERMMVVSTDLSVLKQLRLEIADLHFDMGNLESAESSYNEFIKSYPGSDEIEYVDYKSILCSFYQTLDPHHDQSKTEQTISLAKKFLSKNLYKTYVADVSIIQKQCVNTLFESEINIFNFYLEQKKLNAAEQRLAYIKEHFSTILSSHEPLILTLESSLARQQGNLQLAQEKQQELALLQEQNNTLTDDGIKVSKNYVRRF